MGSFFAPTRSASNITTYTGLQLQTATNTVPIPIIYGKNKSATNVIFYQNFQPHRKKPDGGKGGLLGGGGGPGNITYSCDIALSLCEGPIDGIDQYYDGSAVYPFSAFLASLFLGSPTQAPWAYMATAYPAYSLPYARTAYLGAASYDLGSSASIGNLSFEIRGILFGTGQNGVDAEPGSVILDFLTNGAYGAYFPIDLIDQSTLIGSSGDSSLESYCWCMGICFSPLVNQSETAASIVTRWLQICNATAIRSGGLLKFISYADMSLTANGRSYAAQTAVRYVLSDDDFIHQEGEDPIKISRVDPLTLPSVQRVEVLNRSSMGSISGYQPWIAEARDQAASQLVGQRVGDSLTFHEICETSIAGVVSQTVLQRLLYVRTHYTFTVSWELCLLDPMDIVSVSDSDMGLSNVLVRIIDIEEDDMGLLTIHAEEFVVGVSTPGPNPIDGTSAGTNNAGVAATPVTDVLIYEPPSQLTQGGAELWFGACGSPTGVIFNKGVPPTWGGAILHMSTDGGTTYQQIGRLGGPIKQGVLTTSLASATGFDTTHTVGVDMTSSIGALLTTTDSSARNGTNKCLIGTEVLSFATATPTGVNLYDISRLPRALYSTVAGAHIVGDKISVLDEVIAHISLDTALISVPCKFKFQSFNKWGFGLQDISTCTVYSYTPTGVGVGGAAVSTQSQTVTCSGASVSTSSAKIPANSILLSITVKNMTTVTGPTGYNVDPQLEANGSAGGVTGEFGTAIGLTSGLTNLDSVPSTLWNVDSYIVLTAQGSNFTGGTVLVTIKYLTI
jgi:hypothetical protein